MSVKMKTNEYISSTQIFAIPDHYVALAFKHPKALAGSEGLATLVDGKYIVKAGTFYPANDATAIGVVMNDYDVTDGDKVMAIVIHGFIKGSALPAEPNALVEIPLLKIISEFVVNVSGVELDKATATLAANATLQLKAVVAPYFANDKSITWTSSDGDVAIVNSSGLVTAIATGTATITATANDGNKTDTCAITVSA